MNKKVYFTEEPRHCEICYEPLDQSFVNGQTTDGHHAIMCTNSYTVHGYGNLFGVGFGQLFVRDDDGRFIKHLG